MTGCFCRCNNFIFVVKTVIRLLKQSTERRKATSQTKKSLLNIPSRLDIDVPPANQFFAVKLQYPSNSSEHGLSKHVEPSLQGFIPKNKISIVIST